MGLSGYQRHKLKKFIKELEEKRARHTEFVTVYVPEGYELTKIIGHLAQEQGTATNIKSSATRKNVIDALERMIQHLRLYKRTPSHGLAVFSGNVSEREGQSDVQVWSIEPPVPLKLRLYRCDKEFILEPLQDMVDIKEAFGLVVLDRRDAHIALLKGKAIVPLVKTHSEVPGKFKAGGQSAPRFQRLREGAAKDHYKKVAEYMKEQFLGMENLKGIIVGGPGPTKYDFVEGNYITNEVKKKIIAIKDLSYTEDFGLQELLEKSSDVLANEEVSAEKILVTKFLSVLATDASKISYGMDSTMKALKMGAVDILLLSEDLDENIIEEFEKEAEQFGTEVRLISTETREGVQLKEIGKIGGFLRFSLDT